VLAGSDVVITWQRRARILGDLVDGTGTVPLSEDSEAYELEILAGDGTVLRTTAGLTETTWTYTAAHQDEDTTATSSPAYVRIFQISAQVGRGFPGTRLFEGAVALVSFGEVIAEGQAGAGTSGFQGDRVLAQRYTVPEDGEIGSLGGYLAGGSATMRMAVYADDGGEPGALLAASADKAVSSTSAGLWEIFDLASPLPLAAGQKVWIAGHADGGIDSRGSDDDDQDEARRLVDTSFASGLPDPFGSASSYGNTRGMRANVEVRL